MDKYNHEKYPIIIGKKYQYFDLKDEKIVQTDEYGILDAADLEKDVFELKVINSNFFWRGQYGSFVFHWKIVKE